MCGLILAAALLVAPRSALAGMASVPPIIGGPYFAYYDQALGASVSAPTVSELVQAWWAAYTNFWEVGNGQCGYTFAPDPNGPVTNDFGLLTATGQCSGADQVMGGSTQCPAGSIGSNGTCVRNSSVPDPAKTPGCGGKNAGDPCNAGTGNEFEIETDYRGTGPFPLRFTRTYNAHAFDTAAGATLGALGDAAWQASYFGAYVYEVPDGGSVSTAFVHRPDGKVLYFTFESNTWAPDSDVNDILTQTSSGWTLSFPNGAVETYDASGRLLSITNAAGLSQTLSYDPTTGYLTSVTDPFGHSLAFTYNTNGQLATMTDPAGNAYTYAYTTDGNDNLSSVTFPDGKVKTYLYDETNYAPAGNPDLLTGVIDENGNRYATITYNTAGQVIETTHPQTTNSVGQQQTTLSYAVNSAGAITSTTVTDAAGNVRTMNFAVNLGVPDFTSETVATASGVVKGTLTQTFDGNNNLTCHEDEDGHVTTYTYDSTNQLVSKTEGQTGSCSAPVSGSATRTTTYTYLSPTLDLLTGIDRPSVDSGQNFDTVIAYGDSTHPLLPTSITQNGYTPSGSAVSRTIQLTYTPSGQIATLTDPLGHVTTFSYYGCTTGGDCGELQSITNALDQATSYPAYYADGLVQSRTDPNGTSDQYAYDALRRFTSDVTDAGAIRHVTYAYWPSGQLGSTYFSTGLTVTNSYDTAQELTSTVNSLGDGEEYYYGPRGNQTVSYISNPGTPMGYAIEEQSKSYDVWNHLSLFSNTDGTTSYVNDALGNVLQVIAPNEQGQTNPASTQNQYDALNRLVETVDRAGGQTSYSYDANDHLTAVTAPNGATTTYVVDDLGDVLSETSPDRGTTTYTYDAAGNLTSKTDARGRVTDYTYDALNRLTGITYPSDSTENVTYTYDTPCTDGIGHLCAETDESGSSTYSYDGFGYLVSDTRSEPGGPYTTTYSPDPFGAIDSETYPDGRVITYTRDAAERITAVTATVNGATQTILSDRVWRADNRISSQTWGNGLAETRDYDYAGRLTTQAIGSDTRVYGYDPDGNLTSLQTIPQVDCFGYDVLDRLTQDTASTQSGATCPPSTPEISYTYDGNGNRLSKTTGTTTTPYTYTADSNRLTGVGGSAVNINKIGDITADSQGQSFAYDAAGRLIQATSAYGVLGEYSYDAQNRRANKFSANGSTWYHYDAQGHLIEETHNDGTLVRDYLWADNTPIAMITKDPTTGTETVTYLHTDYDNTPRLATDSTGTILWRWEGVFGTTSPNPNQVNVTLRYPGQTYDSETGLSYNWNRYYDPSTGRYVSPDPVSVAVHAEDYFASLIRMRIPAALVPLPEFPGLGRNSLPGANMGMMPFNPDLNGYAYAAGNPLSYIDPTGLYQMIFPGQKKKDVPNNNPVTPKPAFPPPSPICAKQCTAEYYIGVAQCAKSCRIKLFGYNGLSCEMSWHLWQVNCQENCAD